MEATEGGIREGQQQIKKEDTVPLINDLEIGSIFKDKAKEGGDSITDMVMLVCQLVRQDLRELQELVNIIEPVELWDEGQPSHMITTQYVST